MYRKNFNITIEAPKEKVWEKLWGEDTYPQWAAAFAEGSRADSDWQEGSRILFLDSNNRGMVSKISEKNTMM